MVAATACWILVLVPYTFLVGLGHQGLIGLGKVAVMFQDPDAHDLGVSILRLVAATGTDGVFPLAFVALAATITNRHFQKYVTSAPRVRWRLVLMGLGLAGFALSPLLLAQWASAPGPLPMLAIAPDFLGRSAYGLAALLLIPAAAAEELMFRGWLLRQIAAFTRKPGMVIGSTAVLFSAAHLDFTPDAFLNRALMGAGFAYMTLRLGGIELATGAHAANNLLIVLFIEPLTLQSPGRGDLSAVAWLSDIILLAGYVVITEAVARIAPLRRWAGVRASEVAPEGGAARFS
jgi:hypothetical protein